MGFNNKGYFRIGEAMDREISSNQTGQKRNYIIFTIAVFLAYAFFGFSDTARSTAFPRIQDDLKISEMQLGLLMAINSVGYLIACSFTAKLAGIIGIKACMITALCVQACSGVLIFLTPNFEMLAAAFLVLNLGNGMLDVSTGVIAAMTFTKRTGTMMNIAHCFYGVGMSLAPVVTVGLMMASAGGRPLTFRHMYLIILSFAILPAIIALLGRLKKQEREKSKTGFSAVLKKPTLWLTVLILALGSIAEMGVVSWFPNFLEKTYSFTGERAASYLTLFCVCIMATRLIIGPVVDKLGFINTLAIATAFAGIMITLGVLLGKSGSVFLVLAGIGIAPIFPTVMAVIAKLFSENIDLAMTSILTANGVIMVPSSYMVGGIINQARLVFTEAHGDAGISMAYSTGYLFLGLVCFGSCIAALFLRKSQSKTGQIV